MKSLKYTTLVASLALSMSCAMASGLEQLAGFIKTTKSGRCDFTQVVTSPANASGVPARTKTSSGVFEFARPHKFRFHYKKPFEQTIVADGQTLWLYDPDLNQATARKQGAALGSTPAVLIASASDLKGLEADFELADGPTSDGLEWAIARPKSKDSTVSSIRLGFRGSELSKLEIQDNLGQKSVLTFAAFQINPALPAGTFDFKPPAGTDVIRQ
jgi:outer membrane lipoprotein carrier protein